MSFFKQSTLFRDDFRFMRFCGHPATAAVNLISGIALYLYLGTRPAPETSAVFWLAVAAVPGLWLFIAGAGYWADIMIKWMFSTRESIDPQEKAKTWKQVLLQREGFALIVAVMLVKAMFNYHGARPFDDFDFQQCIQGLGYESSKVLANSDFKNATRDEFRALCWKARKAAPPIVVPPPLTVDEFKHQYSDKK